MSIRRITIYALLFAVSLCMCLAQAQPDDPGNALIGFLNQSIEWYRHIQLPGQLSTTPSDSIYSTYNRNYSVQVISLIFDSARAEAQQIRVDHPQNSAPSTENRLSQLVAAAQDKVKQAVADLDALQKQAANSNGKKTKVTDDQIAEQKSELDLARARLEALQNMSAFAVAGAEAGLLGKINDLERNIPEARIARDIEHRTRPKHSEAIHTENPTDVSHTDTSPSALGGTITPSENATEVTSSGGPSTGISPFSPLPVSAPAAAPAPAKQPSNSIISLAGDVVSLSNKLRAQRDALAATAQLRETLNRVRAPLSKQVRAVNQRGDDLSNQPQSNDPAVLADRRKQIDALTADFRRLSTILLPLAKANLLLDSISNNLAGWQSEAERDYSAKARSLLFRVGFLVLAIILVGVAADFWRRAVFRYIREPRRRNQFLLLRRIVVTVVIALILVFALSTEIGSLATFAGFLTAGIAFALQNVILSVAAYFFLIGRYGIRVGDRIQIGDVTGDVVNIGLVRLHLVELDVSGGEARPTGRIVVFSNSVVFQPSSNFFKQLPGSNFAWRRISLTLAADVDYALAERCISAAVAGVYDTYKPELDQQHLVLERSLAIHIAKAEPQTRLRLQETGLEIIVLYPIVLSQAAQIDDRMTHALLDTIASEPRLRLVGGGLTNITPVDATPTRPVATS